MLTINTRSLVVEEAVLRCSKCRKCKPATREYFYKRAANKSAFNSWCRACTRAHADKDESKERARRNARYYKFRSLGFTHEMYNDMLIKQQGRCFMCGDLPKQRALNLDHNHMTGQLRSLLCTPCNTVVGWLEKQPERVRKALAYIEHYGGTVDGI